MYLQLETEYKDISANLMTKSKPEWLNLDDKGRKALDEALAELEPAITRISHWAYYKYSVPFSADEFVQHIRIQVARYCITMFRRAITKRDANKAMEHMIANLAACQAKLYHYHKNIKYKAKPYNFDNDKYINIEELSVVSDFADKLVEEMDFVAQRNNY